MTDKQNLDNNQGQQSQSGDNHAYEIRRIAEKMGTSEDEVRDAIEQVGFIPEKVEAYLTDKGGFNEQPSTR